MSDEGWSESDAYRADFYFGKSKALAASLEHAYRALWRCVELSGADMSDGIPTEPPITEYAVQCVEELRRDYDEACAA